LFFKAQQIVIVSGQMNNIRVLLSIIFVSLIFCTSCKRDSQRAFYYWKSVFQLTSAQEKYLEELNISKLYIRFFDVDWDEATGKIFPNATIRFKDKVSDRFEKVPVVYITNKSILNSSANEVTEMAGNILSLVDKIAEDNQIEFQEIQIDCDWTNKSKEKYFRLLDEIKLKLAKREVLLSATIRLHQIKYKSQTGIPPIDRGMLMYYNMGKITASSSDNSIYNADDAAKYVSDCKDYPLALDIVIPLFSWGIHIRDEKVIELLNNMNYIDFENNERFTELSFCTFSANQSFFYKGFYFMKDDIVRIEDVTAKDCQAAAEQLEENVDNISRTIAIFHLDTLTINRYETKDLEEVFNTLD
jgi:hypothetical protein